MLTISGVGKGKIISSIVGDDFPKPNFLYLKNLVSTDVLSPAQIRPTALWIAIAANVRVWRLVKHYCIKESVQDRWCSCRATAEAA